MERRQGRQTGGAREKRGGLLGGCLTTASVTERFAGTKFRLIAAEARRTLRDKGGGGGGGVRCGPRAGRFGVAERDGRGNATLPECLTERLATPD